LPQRDTTHTELEPQAWGSEKINEGGSGERIQKMGQQWGKFPKKGRGGNRKGHPVNHSEKWGT